MTTTRAVVLARGPLVTSRDLPMHVHGLTPEPAASEGPSTFVEKVSAYERRLIADALTREGGVQTRAARLLGMSERHLRYKLKKYELDEAASLESRAGGASAPEVCEPDNGD